MTRTAVLWFGAAAIAAGVSLTGAAAAAADSGENARADSERGARPHTAPRALAPPAPRTAPSTPAAARPAVTTQPTQPDVKPALSSANVDLENWMARLPGVDRLPLTRLPIPGTHDSGAGSISASSPWASTGINDFGLLTQLPDWLAKPVVLNWAKTHNKSLTEQFADGIRYVDVRLSYEPDGQIYIEHGLRGASVDDVISQVASFAETHPKEVLLVNMGRMTTGVPTSSWTPQMHEVLVAKLQEGLGSRMAPDSLGTSATLQDFWAIDRNVVLMYSDGAVAAAHDNLWSSDILFQPWPNVAAVGPLFNANYRYLGERDPSKIWGLSGQTTPDTTSIVRGLLLAGPDSIESLMRTVHPSLQNWLRYDFADSVNLVTTDFYDAPWTRGSYVRDVLASVDGAYIAPRSLRSTKVNYRSA